MSKGINDVEPVAGEDFEVMGKRFHAKRALGVVAKVDCDRCALRYDFDRCLAVRCIGADRLDHQDVLIVEVPA